MSKADKITKAKIKLILEHPFFATLALKKKYIEKPNIRTAETDGPSIWYNPTWIESLHIDAVVGLIVHELMHPAMFHHTRRQGRKMGPWNRACDFAINPIIVESGIQLPPNPCLDQRYSGKSAEEIYSLLPPSDDGDGDDNDPGNCGAVIDGPAKTQSELNQLEAEMKQDLAQAATVAKQQGKLPAHLERLVNELLAPKVYWKEVLQRFLCQIAHNDYTWTKPSKRYLHMGLYLPALESIETGEIVLFVDTSGSIDRALLNQFASEIQDIASSFGVGFKVVYIDAEVAGVQDIEPDEAINLTPAGGGGTDFRPGFDYLAEQGIEPCAVIYFTDGQCNDFPKDPGYPVLWALHENKDFEAPFGEYVHL